MLSRLWRCALKQIRNRGRGRRPRTARLGVEMLEDRMVMSTTNHLAIIQQPTDVTLSGPIQPGVMVELLDQNNNLVTNSTDPVTIALGANSSGAVLSGTTTVPLSGGIAQFNDLSISTTGTGYTLVATDPNLGAPSIGLSIAGAKGGEIVIHSLSFGATASGGVASFDNVKLALDTSAADPELLGYLVRNKPLDPITLHIRNASNQEYLTYTLTGASVISLDTSGSGNGLNDSLTLSFTQFSESYRPTNADGSLGNAVVFSYDVANHSVLAAPAFTIQAATTPPALALSFSGLTGEIALNSYAVGAVGSSNGPSFTSFNIGLQGSAADPGFLAALVQNQDLGTATIHVRNLDGQGALTYTLTGATVSGLRTRSTGDTTTDSLSLGFTEVSVNYTPPDTAGAGNSSGTTLNAALPGDTTTPDTFAYNVLTGKGNYVFQPTPLPVAATPLPVSLSISGINGEIAVTSFNVSDGVQADGLTHFSNFNLTLAPTALDPVLLSYLAKQSKFDTVTLHVRNAAGKEYLTYTLTFAFVTSVQTNADGNTLSDQISFSFSMFSEAYRATNPADGTLGSPVVFGYDVSNRTITSVPAPALTIQPATAPPSLGLSFGGIAGEIALNSAQESANANGLISFAPFQVSFTNSAVEPALLDALEQARSFATVTIHVRDSSGFEYQTYTLSNATIRSLAVNSQGEQLAINFGQFSESFPKPNDPLHPLSSVNYDANLQKLVGKAPVLASGSPPSIGISFDNIVGELPILSYASSDSTPGGIPAFSAFQIYTEAGVIEPALLAALGSTGADNGSATIHVRNAAGQEYLTYTLANFTMQSVLAELNPFAAIDSFAVNFGTITESYRPTNPDGTLGNPIVFTYNVARRTLLASPPLTIQPAVSLPTLGLSFSGIPGEVALTSLSENATSTSGLPNLSDLQASLGGGASDPGLLAALVQGRQLGTATIHVRNASGTEYLTYTLTGATVTSLTTSDANGSTPSDGLTLGFTQLTESYSPTSLDGKLGKPLPFSFNRATDSLGSLIPSTTVVGPSVADSVTSNPFAVNNPTPVLIGLSQYAVTEGSSDLTLSVTGSRFVAGAQVQVNSENLETTYVSPTQLTAVIPAGMLTDETSYFISVANPTPGGGISAALLFTVQDVTPTDSIIGPTTAFVNQPVTFILVAKDSLFDQVNGFTYTINWGDGSPVQTIAGPSGTQINHTFAQANMDSTGAVIPYQVQVTATDFDGTAGNTASLNVMVANPTPVLTSLSQSSISEGSTDLSLTVYGSSFVPGSTVQFNGTTVATTFVSGSQLTAIIPASFLADESNFAVTVATPTPGGGISGSVTFRVVDVPPTASISGPSLGVPGQPRTFTLLAADVSPIEQSAGFTFTVNWGDGSPVQIVKGPSGIQVNHIFTQPQVNANGAVVPYQVQISATDSDGVTGPTGSLSVLVQSAQLQGTTLAVGGTTGKDRIILRPADANGNIEVRLNHQTVGIFHPTGQIVIYTQGGDDVVRLKSMEIHGKTYSITVPAILFGGNGGDVLDVSGSTAANVLIGGSGNDTLIGGSGATILIGGGGKDQLMAGAGDTILIGGTTDYDPSSTRLSPDQQLRALDAILAEWSRTDLHGTRQQNYQQRVNDLLGTNVGGLNASYYLNASSVHDDNAADQLVGDTQGLDWFFIDPFGKDHLKGKRAGEVTTQD